MVQKSRLTWLTAAALALLVLVTAAPAEAQSKQARYDEMIDIAGEIAAIKGNPASAGQLAQLRARYEQLSSSLGGDDPGAIFQGALTPATGSLGAGIVPPSCVSTPVSETSTDTPLPINDNATTTSTITVVTADTYLADVNVITDITHTFAADLEFSVTSPSGTTVTLSTDNGGGSDDVFAGTVWDDDGGDTNPPGAATDNTYVNGVTETPLVAEEALGAFIGEDPNGVWSIDIFDDAGGDTGTLNSWTLDLTTLASAPIDDPLVSETSTDTPLPISDGVTTTSNITVSGANTFLCDVNVTTDITHTFAADLEFSVTSPGGTTSTLSTDNGGGSDDVFAGTVWDDDGGDTNPPGPATDNTYTNLVTETPLVAEEALGAFIGEDPNGTWSIDIFDDAGGDTGTLNSWTVDVTTCSCVIPDADLEVSKTGSLNGDQVIWTIGVQNNGPDDATGVVVTDMFDACSTYISDDCGGMVVPPWTWNVGALPNGAAAFCNVTVDVSGCAGTISNTVDVTGNENDPVPGNNAAIAEVTQSPLVIPTLDTVGLALLALILALGAVMLMRRRASA